MTTNPLTYFCPKCGKLNTTEHPYDNQHISVQSGNYVTRSVGRHIENQCEDTCNSCGNSIFFSVHVKIFYYIKPEIVGGQ